MIAEAINTIKTGDVHVDIPGFILCYKLHQMPIAFFIASIVSSALAQASA